MSADEAKKGAWVDISRGETVERELDAMIERRSRKGEADPDEREELWKESVRRYEARRREENRLAWCDYFGRLAACLRARAEEYDRRAAGLMEATDERRILSVLVWPSLESDPRHAAYAHHQRVEEVKRAIAKGAAEMAWSTRFETDYGLGWDAERQVWTVTDGYAFDAKGTHDAA